MDESNSVPDGGWLDDDPTPVVAGTNLGSSVSPAVARLQTG